MAITYRPMRSADIPRCVALVRADPVLGSQYCGESLHLDRMWRELLGREAFRAVVFEETLGASIRLIGSGVSVFVSENFIAELKTPPLSWIGPEITRRIASGKSPLLSDRAVRSGNSDGGLSLAVWIAALDGNHVDSLDAHAVMFTAFVAEHRGFLLKEVISCALRPETLEGMLRSGGLLVDSTSGLYLDSPDKPLTEIFSQPHVVGLNRELAKARFGTWIGSLFNHQPPQFGLRPSDQRLLLAALRGGTDSDLARELGISVSAVKKTWRSVYARVALRAQGLIPHLAPEEPSSQRGREKKQRLMAYMREHPEELRPASPLRAIRTSSPSAD
jgi:DNA-binding CsgD family transcriptional regulator